MTPEEKLRYEYCKHDVEFTLAIEQALRKTKRPTFWWHIRNWNRWHYMHGRIRYLK